MNKRERKQAEKLLGLNKYKKSLSRKERFTMMRENIEKGKKKQEEMKEVRRLQENQAQDEKQSINVDSKATELMIKEGLSYIDALEKAEQLANNKE